MEAPQAVRVVRILGLGVSVDMVNRMYWQANTLNVVDEPLFLSLIKYDMKKDRVPDPEGNLISSHVEGTNLHAPIIDLDFPHRYIKSTSDGHGHLYIDVPMSKLRLILLLVGLRIAGVIEMGNFWWSLRRGGTFVRRPGVRKSSEDGIHYTYGMFFKLRKRS